MAYLPVKNQSVSGTVGASIVGAPYVGIFGSVATVGTAAANQSVSGQVEAVIVGGSITTVGGTTGNSSVQVVNFPTNQSVSGNIGLVGTPSISGAVTIVGASSMAALQGTSPWLITGSVATRMITGVGSVFLQPGVSAIGSVAALQGTNPWIVSQPSGSIIATQIAGSVMAVSGSFSGGNSSVQLLQGVAAIGSVAVLQGTNPWTANIGTMPLTSVRVVQQTDPWKIDLDKIAGASAAVSGGTEATALRVTLASDSTGLIAVKSSIAGGVFPVNGSVTALQGTNPWIVSQPSGSIIATQIAGSVMNVNISGSVATVGTAAANQSVSGSVGIVGTPSISGAVTIVGSSSITALQGTNPWIVNQPSGSIIATQIAGSVMAVSGSFSGGNSSVQVLNNITIANPNSSVQLISGSNVLGSVATLQGTSPWLITGSVANAMIRGVASVYLMPGVNAIGSVTTLQGTNPWFITTAGTASVISANSYSEDAAHTTGSRGAFTLGVRNDTMASVTSADNYYSPFAVGPSGETIVANAPITKWISATTSVMAGPSVLVFAAPGASIFNYVSGYHLTNPGTVAAHVAFSEGLGAVPASILFFGIAPAGGGSNVIFRNPIKTSLANKNISASVSAHSSVYITMEGFKVKQLT